MDRRRALHHFASLVGFALGIDACRRRDEERFRVTRPPAEPALFPVLFVAHGAPPLLDDEGWMAELSRWAEGLPRPRAILSISAHWEARPVAIGATRALPLVYDFYGFPSRYYRVQYPSPGAPDLARRVRELLASQGIPSVDQPDRGLDHGTYVPLLAMYEAADVPVLQISLPGLEPEALAACGRALAPLRRDGVLILGSGFLTHNLRALGERTTPAWASEFDAWVMDVLARRDLDELLDFERRAPAARLAHPRTEHFAPVIVAAAAASTDPVSFPITGFWELGPAFTRRSVQFG